MAWWNTITAIDVWTSKIRTLIWNFSEDKTRDFHVLWLWVVSSNAIRKWNILDMEEFKSNLDKSLEEAEKMSNAEVHGVQLSFNSSSFDVVVWKWIIAITWEEIAPQDIDRVLDMARNSVDLPNREILKVVPEYFIVDYEEWVKNPIWMSARKLEVVASIFSMNKNILGNIKKAVRDVGIEIYDILPNLLTAPEWVLTKRQKELWVVCIDIGASTTWVTVYEEGVMKFSTLIPVWWDSVTNDIALWARTAIDVAEKLKLNYSQISLQEWDMQDETIQLRTLSPNEDWEISTLYLSQIVTARYDEILYFVAQELKKIGRDGMLPEWAVIVWGGAKEYWLQDLAKKVLRLPVFIWVPQEKQNLSGTTISDPVFASVVWSLIFWNKNPYEKGFQLNLNIWWIFDSLKKIIRKLIP